MQPTQIRIRKKVSFIGNSLPSGASVVPGLPMVGVSRLDRRQMYGLPRDGEVPNSAPVFVRFGGKRLMAIGVMQLRQNLGGTGLTFLNNIAATKLGVTVPTDGSEMQVVEVEGVPEEVAAEMQQIVEQVASGGASWPDAE